MNQRAGVRYLYQGLNVSITKKSRTSGAAIYHQQQSRRCSYNYASIFFFSLFHQRADDEALTRFLQTSLFLVASPVLVKSMLCFHGIYQQIRLFTQVERPCNAVG